MNYNDEGFAMLQDAIVKQAAHDYRYAYRKLLKLKRKGDPDEIRAAKDRCNYLERWFFSDWGAQLCNDLGSVILERIRKEEMQKHLEGVNANGAKT